MNVLPTPPVTFGVVTHNDEPTCKNIIKHEIDDITATLKNREILQETCESIKPDNDLILFERLVLLFVATVFIVVPLICIIGKVRPVRNSRITRAILSIPLFLLGGSMCVSAAII